MPESSTRGGTYANASREMVSRVRPGAGCEFFAGSAKLVGRLAPGFGP